ncbi:hypothetical protein CSC94_08670 [Zhengella mangrovi]|uniref:CHAT domain-containing protein n=1 Tax=Zhengella mangrovi TaxID=1982044 RepID=A0A2G1QQM0_9HYPH|nr:CHAT domain-containing tetratricopeptide repeat protein [Zhengella mangrovi]PHP67750.1 hypothetical protein CSC94_08670 [Zhengella mangrovi]
MDAALALAQAAAHVTETYLPADRATISASRFRVHTQAMRARHYRVAATALERISELDAMTDAQRAYVENMAGMLADAVPLNAYRERPDVQLDYAFLGLTFAKAAGTGSDARTGLAYRNLAAAKQALGRSDEAIDLLQRAAAALDATEEGRKQLFLVLEDLASAQWKKGELDLAKALYARADSAYATALALGVTPDGPSDRAILLSNRAQLNRDMGEPAEALDLIDRALALHGGERARRAFKWNDETLLAQFHEIRATILADTDHRREALAESRQAVAIARAFFPKDSPDLAMRLGNAADLHGALGETAQARDLAGDAVAIFERVLPWDAPDLAEARMKIVVADLQDGDYEDADQVLETIVRARVSPVNREHLAESAWSFEVFAWNRLLLGKPGALDAALDAIRWTQLNASAKALSGAAQRLSETDPALAALLRERQDLRDEADMSRAALTGLLSRPEAERSGLGVLRQRLDDIRARLAAIDDQMAARTGGDLGLGTATPVTVRTIQAQLRPGEAIVTHFLASIDPARIAKRDGSANFVIAITPERAGWAPMREVSRSALVRRAGVYRCQMALSDPGCAGQATPGLRGVLGGSDSGSRTGNDQPGFDLAAGHALYADVIAPVADLIDGADTLIIVPPADLLPLPFEALVTAPVARDSTIADVPWLIRRHAISVVPSLASFLLARRTAPSTAAPDPFLGVGDPRIGHGGPARCGEGEHAALRAAPSSAVPFLASAGGDDAVADTAAVRALPRLPDTACELRALSRQLGGQPGALLTGRDATETAIKAMNADGRLNRYRVLSFATHGIVAGEIGSREPGLILTPPPNGSRLDDGVLTASEIAALSLNADLVVLSACNTAAGAEPGGEGLSGLARAFFHAGSRALLVTHWSVYSQAASRLVPAMVADRARHPGDGYAQALRRAVLAVIDDPGLPEWQRHPSYWAPFALIGAP